MLRDPEYVPVVTPYQFFKRRVVALLSCLYKGQLFANWPYYFVLDGSHAFIDAVFSAKTKPYNEPPFYLVTCLFAQSWKAVALVPHITRVVTSTSRVHAKANPSRSASMSGSEH